MLLFLFRAKVQRNRSRVKERLCETRAPGQSEGA